MRQELNRRKITKHSHILAMTVVSFALIFTWLNSHAVIKKSFADAPTCTQTISVGTNLSTTISSAPAGSTICLNAGNYGNVVLNNVSKSNVVTVVSASGIRTAAFNLTFNGGGKLRFENLTLKGFELNEGTHDVSLVNNNVTAMSVIKAQNITNANLLIDSSTFDDLNEAPGGYEGRLQIVGPENNAPDYTPVGLKITNNHFGGGGCSDGIDIGGSAVEVGPGNVFEDLQQTDPQLGPCGVSQYNNAHVDGVFLYGSAYTKVYGNYFKNNEDSIACFDGCDHEQVTHNIIDQSSSRPAIELDGLIGGLVAHNTSNRDLLIRESNEGVASSGIMVRDNLMRSLTVPAGNTQNNNIPYATAKFTGCATAGCTPATWAGFLLASGSPGKGAASDGGDIGSQFFDADSPSSAIYDTADLNNLIAHYGRTTGMTITDGDLNGDGAVNVFDLGILLSSYGA